MDATTLEDILWHIHNWFERESVTAKVEIAGGELPASVSERLLEGQWYRIEGSYLNDGLHQHPDTELSDETFDGTITLLAIPRPLLRLAQRIQDYIDQTADATEKARRSPFQSESFDGYSYSLKSGNGSNSASGGLSGWQSEFAGELNAWRKPY